MNILLISYGDFDYDGRLRELYKAFSSFGTLYSVTRGAVAQNSRHKICNERYSRFIREAVEYGKRLEPVDVLVLDNRKSIVPGFIIQILKKPKVVIQDCRELYIAKEVTHFTGKIGCLVEKLGVKSSDIIICANKERAKIMQKLFDLRDMPIVYENLRALTYSNDDAQNIQSKKFAGIVRDDEIRIISSSGCSVSRTNDVLVNNLSRVSRKCRLILVGSNTDDDEATVRKIIKDNGLDNVEILGQVNQDELKYLISISQIGVVNYHRKDTNNKYCASGKVYEFLYEGIPVVTTTNPPLKDMCDNAKIGEADDSYADGINKIIEHYEEYRMNVLGFAQQNSVEENNKRLIQQVRERLAQILVNR